MFPIPFLVAVLIGGRPDAPPPPEPRSVVPELPAAAASGRPSAPACAALADGSVLLVWESREEGGESDILFSRRDPGKDGGWLAAPVRLDSGPPGASRSIEPRIATGAPGHAYVAWQDARDGRDDIRVTRSTDGGRTWGADLRVDGGAPGAATSSMPALAADREGRVYLAWEDQRNGNRDIYFARSTDGGATFLPDVRLDADKPGAGTSYHPALLCREDGTVLAFWRDERDGQADVYVRRSEDAGATWRVETRLDPGPAGDKESRYLGVSAVGARIATLWVEGGTEVLVRMSPDAGESWNPPARLAPDWRTAPVAGDPLLATAAEQGMVPAAALEGRPALWTGASGNRTWTMSVRDDGALRVAPMGDAVRPTILEPEAGASRPTVVTGVGLPGESVFLAWVRETDSGPRLEAVAVAGGKR